ncbi:MAG: hypothetical protein ACRD3J_18805, partial [Thermoanaerobaculia bacterium]
AERLRRGLDAFIGDQAGVRHAIDVWTDNRQGVVCIDLHARNGEVTVHSPDTSSDVLKQVSALRGHLDRELSQWHYFNRNLRVFVNRRVYLFKPLHRFHWIESQAIQDAAEVVGLVLQRAAAPV